MPLDPEFKDIIELFGEMPSFSELPLEALRGAPPPNSNPIPMAEVRDEYLPGPAGNIPIRIYRALPADDLPLLLFMHGGGFVMGNLDTHDDLARELTAAIGCVTISVDYRLAPEHPYPAAVDDCYYALQWSAGRARDLGANPDELVVIGDSAGGNLAAVTAMRVRDEGGPDIAAQILIYPVADMSGPMLPAPDGNFYILSPETRKFFNEAYLSDPAQATLPTVSPGLAEDLSGLPRTLVITAEYDPLCSQGEALAERYRQDGVRVTHSRYDGAIHGFATFPVQMRHTLQQEIAQWLAFT